MPISPDERTKPRIRISSPCPMRWESLVPVAGGRHCEACRRTVIDVERLSGAEVDALVASGERACVRVTTLADGSILTRDHPRALRRAAAWAGAALAASTFACSERVTETDAPASRDWELPESTTSGVEESEAPAVHREFQSRANVPLDGGVRAVTVGGLELAMRDDPEESPPMPGFDLTASASDPTGMAGEETAMLGGIGASLVGIEEPPLPVLEVELDLE